LQDEQDLTHQATLSTTSEFILTDLPPDGPLLPLSSSAGQMLPLPSGPVPHMTAFVTADQDTTLTVELRGSRK
jgi:hypothetical protein